MRFLLLVVMCFSSVLSYSQSQIQGNWSGSLHVGAQKLRLNFNIIASDTMLTATMDSPDQGAMGLIVSHTEFKNDTIKMSLNTLRAAYVGTLKGDSLLVGEFKQSGMKFPLTLRRGYVELNRPQEPKSPYNYKVEEVTFQNKKENFKLAGTLTLPLEASRSPVVILISGSGLQDRDETIFGHKPFAVIADYLTQRGIAVLRFDDRSVGGSEGDATHATTADFATDVISAVNYLQTRKDIDKHHIGLIGHSEGGLIAPIVAQQKKIAFIVLMASPGVQGSELLLEQQQLMGRAGGMTDKQLEAMKYNNAKLFAIVEQAENSKQASDSIWAYINASDIANDITFNKEAFGQQVKQLTTPWMMYFLKYDPTQALSKVKCPVMVLNGERDLQVSAKQNMPPIKLSLKLGGNEKIEFKSYEELNHLFQECKTGSIGEYSMIEQTLSPQVLHDIQEWITQQSLK